MSDKFSSKDDDETLMKEFRLLKIPNDAKLHPRHHEGEINNLYGKS